jgi:hypothetical protein
MAEKRTPKEVAEEMESEQNFPVLHKYSKVGKAVEKMKPGAGKDLATGAYFGGMVPVGTAQVLQSAVTGRKGRSQEEMDELTREVGRAQRTEKKAKGGAVKKMATGGGADEKSLPRRMYEKVMGTPEQNAEAQKRMDARDKKNPDTIPAKINRVVDKVTGRKAGGAIKSSASKRGDGIAQRGKTKGRMV